MRRSREPIAVVMAACLLFLGVVPSGCGKEEPPVVWKKSKELPADYPADMPIYPKADLDIVVSGNGSLIIWHTSDPLPAVQAFFTKAMNEKGFHVTTSPGVPAPWMGEGGVVVTGTVWGRQIGFALGEQGAGTQITTIVP